MVDHLTAAGSAGVAVMSAARQLGKRDQVVRASLKRVAIKGDDMRWRLRPGGADPDSPDPYVGTAGRAPVPITRPVPVRVDGTVPDGTRPATPSRPVPTLKRDGGLGTGRPLIVPPPVRIAIGTGSRIPARSAMRPNGCRETSTAPPVVRRIEHRGRRHMTRETGAG